MTLSFTPKLSKGEQQELLDDLNYLNIAETKSFFAVIRFHKERYATVTGR
jgi:hypothetical protein